MRQQTAETGRASRGPDQERFRTFAGTIAQGMAVISAEGTHLGRVERVEGGHIVLASSDDDKRDEYFVPLSLIDGIDRDQVLLAGRGDGIFGLGAKP